MANIPVTFGGSGGLQLHVGEQSYYVKSKTNTFWWVVLDLTDPTGKPLVEELSSSNKDVPANIAALSGRANTLLCFGFNDLFVSNMPTGALYQFLQQVGADAQLRRIEQIVEQSGSNFLDVASYLLVATMDNNDGPGFEELNIYKPAILTCGLMPVDVDGHTVYTPVQLS